MADKFQQTTIYCGCFNPFWILSSTRWWLPRHVRHGLDASHSCILRITRQIPANLCILSFKLTMEDPSIHSVTLNSFKSFLQSTEWALWVYWCFLKLSLSLFLVRLRSQCKFYLIWRLICRLLSLGNESDGFYLRLWIKCGVFGTLNLTKVPWNSNLPEMNF